LPSPDSLSVYEAAESSVTVYLLPIIVAPTCSYSGKVNFKSSFS